jgi:hypothetical protein
MTKILIPGGISVEAYSDDDILSGDANWLTESIEAITADSEKDEDGDLRTEAKGVNPAQAKNVIKAMQSKYKTMARSLVASHKSKSTEALMSKEGKAITSGQKIFLIFLFLCTSVTLIPWLIAWWLMIFGNKNKLQKATRLVQIEIPSTIQEYQATDDEDLKKKLAKLFKHQFKGASKILGKISTVRNLSAAASELKGSNYYQEAIKFNAMLEVERRKK